MRAIAAREFRVQMTSSIGLILDEEGSELAFVGDDRVAIDWNWTNPSWIEPVGLEAFSVLFAGPSGPMRLICPITTASLIPPGMEVRARLWIGMVEIPEGSPTYIVED